MDKKTPRSVSIYTHDFPDDVRDHLTGEHERLYGDTETDGLVVRRDRLRLVQLMDSSNRIYMVRNPDWKSKNLQQVVDEHIITFHHATFDSQFLKYWANVEPFHKCTKMLSKIVKPNESSSLEKVLKRELGIEFEKNKDITKSNWNAPELSKEQIEYACQDVLYLPELEAALEDQLEHTNPDQWTIYNQALTALTEKIAIELQGYTDLMQYEPDPNTVALRNQWLAHKAEMEK